jgi:GTP-binding protein
MSHFPAAAFLTSAHRPDQFLPDAGSELAFAGRSNAGKSSAINAALGRRDLARTSKTPGRTQLVNFFTLGGEYRLVDLPGYGYAKVSRALKAHWQTLIEAYLRRSALAGLILVVDSRRGLGDGDRTLLDWCVAAGCPVHVLLTKADKLSRNAAASTLARERRDLDGAATIQLFAATTRQGVDELCGHMQALLAAHRPAG